VRYVSAVDYLLRILILPLSAIEKFLFVVSPDKQKAILCDLCVSAVNCPLFVSFAWLPTASCLSVV